MLDKVKPRNSAWILISARVEDFSPNSAKADFLEKAVFSAFTKYQVYVPTKTMQESRVGEVES